jgi:hypothetical protein
VFNNKDSEDFIEFSVHNAENNEPIKYGVLDPGGYHYDAVKPGKYYIRLQCNQYDFHKQNSLKATCNASATLSVRYNYVGV